MIIGIAGAAGSGKSTVADYLVKHYGFVAIAMADPMKRICMDVFGWTEENLWGPSQNRDTPDSRYAHLTRRRALQQLGDWGRECYADIWVDYCMRIAVRVSDSAHRSYGSYEYHRTKGLVVHSKEGLRGRILPTRVVIPDVRYDNEARAVRAAGGKMWLVQRPNAGLVGDGADHSSEAGVSPELIDCCVKNDEGFGWLYQQVRLLSL